MATDQGATFTAAAFKSVFAEAGVKISMDGRGRWRDNVFVERLSPNRAAVPTHTSAALPISAKIGDSPARDVPKITANKPGAHP